MAKKITKNVSPHTVLEQFIRVFDDFRNLPGNLYLLNFFLIDKLT